MENDTARLIRGFYAAPSARRQRCVARPRVACVFEVAGGWLVHERLYWDRPNFMRQLGLLPALVNAATTPAVTFS
jgi:hypothetical protein